MGQDFIVELGTRIRIARNRVGLTQSQLAELIDVSTNHISALERGIYEMKVELFARLVKVLGVDAEYLLFGGTEEVSTELERAFIMAKRVHEEDKMAKYILAGVELMDGKDIGK